jgi:hypothetical protein
MKVIIYQVLVLVFALHLVNLSAAAAIPDEPSEDHRISRRDIEFFEHSDHRGFSVFYSSQKGKCYNIEKIQDLASSVNTRGGCIVLFEHPNCRGKQVTVSAGPGNQCAHNNLHTCRFNDITSSFQEC